MALDGGYLRNICNEINQNAIGCRVEKVYQPNKDEIILGLRGLNGASKLLLSARANSPRINFTLYAPENPKVPPMLCMLFRKRLCGAKLIEARQPEMERIIFLDFDATNELGDHIKLTLAVEIMGKYSNVIFIDQEGVIIDALKRVDISMSSQRLVLPGTKYNLPPAQDKLNILETSPEDIFHQLENITVDTKLNKALLNSIQGLSPIICREIEYLTGKGEDVSTGSLTDELKKRLLFFLTRMKTELLQHNCTPNIVIVNGKPMDFSFMDITQYGEIAVVKKVDSFSKLLDDFYTERDTIERMKAKSQDLHRLLSNCVERLSRKINTQSAELAQCTDREPLRIMGDLIQANIYRIEKGCNKITVENFYDNNNPITIQLDPALTATQNSQRYYKNYRKAKTAQQVLTVQIEKAKEDLEYIGTVIESLSRATSEQELSEIRTELMEQGYLKQPKGKQKKTSALPPVKFTSSTGFTILVGRNNKQNDKLTLKTASKTDLWLHTKDIHGTHTIVVTEGKEIDDTTLLEAAQITAYHSKAKNSSQVPVDYTLVKNVSKPAGAKPGMVIYVKNKTIYVTPCIPEQCVQG